MTNNWQPYREPLRRTLLRTGLIALIVGALLAPVWRAPGRWPLTTLLILWPSFGGHWVEILFLNYLRPRLSVARPVQIAARLATWFVGGALIAKAMYLTAEALGGFRPSTFPAWWIGGLAFIAIELVAHLPLQLRGRPSFYNGRG